MPEPTEPLDFAELFRAHAPFALRLLRRLGVADSEAKDVCQDVFVVVHRKLDEIVAPAAARSFIYGVCVRAASDHRRSARVRRERVTDELEEAPASARQDDLVDRRQAVDRLRASVAALDDAKREVFVLYEIEELPMAEVARILECPLQTAYSRLHAARNEIKNAFSRGDLAVRRRVQ